jgi:antitoxin component YwqK of YwqJK toxin-antitoxin module
VWLNVAMLVWTWIAFGCGGQGPDAALGGAEPVKPQVNCGPEGRARASEDGLDQWCEAEGGAMSGPMIRLYPNGKRAMLGRYDNGQADDEWMWWHENGQQAQTGKYSKGKKTGSWTWWHPNGKRSEAGDYLANRKAGQWTTWYESGAKREEGLFHNGQKIGTWTLFNDDPTNTIQRTQEFQNDVLIKENGEAVVQAPAATP